jgi:uroporphyrinogen III methyltransferase/synthase
VKSPSAIVVGEVAALDLAWFESKPLFGRSVVVTRAREQASGLRRRLEDLGADVIELPVIAVEPVAFTLPDLAPYEWVVFTSANGVETFFREGLRATGRDARALAGVKIAAIGPTTADTLARSGITVDLEPERSVAESLLDTFPEPRGNGARVLLPRAEQGRDVLPDGLTARGYVVDVLVVYRTVRAAPDPRALARVRGGDIDAITFTSSSTVDNLCDAVGALPDPQPVVVSIGPATSETARARGLRVDVEADPHTIDGVVRAVLSVLASPDPT